MKLYVRGRPTFFYVFSDFKKHDFLRFFELLHTFSRTLVCFVMSYLFFSITTIYGF